MSPQSEWCCTRVLYCFAKCSSAFFLNSGSVSLFIALMFSRVLTSWVMSSQGVPGLHWPSEPFLQGSLAKEEQKVGLEMLLPCVAESWLRALHCWAWADWRVSAPSANLIPAAGAGECPATTTVTAAGQECSHGLL